MTIRTQRSVAAAEWQFSAVTASEPPHLGQAALFRGLCWRRLGYAERRSQIPRNHQDPTAVSRTGGGGCFLVDEGEDLCQGTDEEDVGLATLLSGMHFDALDHGACYRIVKRSGT